MLSQTAPSLPGDQVVAFVLLNVAIILVVARLLGALALKIGQPRVVGEIVAGVMLGPTVLGAKTLVWGNSWGVLDCDRSLPEGAVPTITSCLFPQQGRIGLSLLGTLALILFMFLVGLELDTKSLAGKTKGILAVGFGVVLIPMASAFALAPALWGDKFVGGWGTDAQPSQLGFTLMIGAMLAVTAFPVAARILQEKGLATTNFGAVGIASAALVTILMFLAVSIARGVAAEAEPSTHVWRLIGTAAYLGVMWFVVRPLMARIVRHDAPGTPLSGTHFAAILIMTLLSAYTADRIGIHVIVGGFVAGLVVPRSRELTTALLSRLSDVAISFLLPVFLAFSGLNTDFTTLGWVWIPGIVLFIAVSIASKWLGGLLSGRAGGLTWSESNVLGVLMNCRGLLVLVVALVALNAGVISRQMQAGAVLMALVTTAMTGPLVDRFLKQPKAQDVDEILTVD